MRFLSQPTLEKLRDQLRETGQRPSIASPGLMLESTDPAIQFAIAEYGTLCDSMYLMMKADGELTLEEREVLKGALRTISDNALRSAHIEHLVRRSAMQLAEVGADTKLAEIAEAVMEDPTRAEVAFMLSAAIAYADSHVDASELALLDRMADAYGIEPARAKLLIAGIHSEVSSPHPKP